MNPLFNLYYYNLLNIDLQCFNNDKYLLMKHYLNFGKNENRFCSEDDFLKKNNKLYKITLLNFSTYEKNNKKNIFHISHNFGGGVDVYISNMISIFNNYNHYVINIINEICVNINNEIYEIKKIINNLFDNCNSIFFIHSLLYFHGIKTNNHEVIFNLLLENNSIKKILVIHDYSLLFPTSWNYINNYTNEPEIKNIELAKLLINNCEMVIFNSSNCYLNFKIYVENLNNAIILNNVPDIDYYNNRFFPNKKEIYNIGIIGNICNSESKGKLLLKKIIQSFENNYKYKFIIFGESSSDEYFNDIKITGKYNNDNIFNLISENNIDYFLFLSIVQETYSFSLSIALKFGVPIIYNNIGAYTERLKSYNNCFAFLENKYEKIYKILDLIENNYNNNNNINNNIKLNNNQFKLYKNIPELSEYLRHNDELNIDLSCILDNLKNKNICFINLFNTDNANLTNINIFNEKINYIKNTNLYEKLDYIFVILLGNYTKIMSDYKIKVIYYSPYIKENKYIICKISKYFEDNIPYKINILNIDFNKK